MHFKVRQAIDLKEKELIINKIHCKDSSEHLDKKTKKQRDKTCKMFIKNLKKYILKVNN